MRLATSTHKIINNTWEKLWLKNPMSFPMINKVVIATWVASLHTRKWVKDFNEITSNIKFITWQHPHTVLSKISISNFKLREWMPAMLKTTLRKQKAYDFLYKVATIVMPRVRDFSWLSLKSFDWTWNYTLWLKSYSLFPELHPDNVTIDVWLQITITTNVTSNEHIKVLLEWCWFVFNE
mgnify:CR=1 FL=1